MESVTSSSKHKSSKISHLKTLIGIIGTIFRGWLSTVKLLCKYVNVWLLWISFEWIVQIIQSSDISGTWKRENLLQISVIFVFSKECYKQNFEKWLSDVTMQGKFYSLKSQNCDTMCRTYDQKHHFRIIHMIQCFSKYK